MTSPQVELPAKFELVLNLKTAESFEIQVPATLAARADEITE
jgi:putative ABC transport system substrate-binding protein